jgi:hypothetical protein
MRDRKRPEAHSGDRKYPTHRGHLALDDGVAPDQPPGLARGIDRTWRAIDEAGRVIRVSVCQHDGRRGQPCHPTTPVGAAVDHDPRTSMGQHKCAMPPVPPTACHDFATRAKERQFHGLGLGM